MTGSSLQTAFIEGAAGHLHLTSWRAANPSTCTLFVPPFGEELNKCRRQIAITAQALARQGRSAAIVDLYGTGDSEGEFASARWETWLADIDAAFSALEAQGCAVDSIVATRLGCILACDALRFSNRSVSQTVFWQPVNSGYRHVSAFLRIAVASSLMRAGPRVSVEELRERLARGETLKVAGYALSPALSRKLDELSLTALADDRVGRLHTLYVSRKQGGSQANDDTRVEDLARELGVRAIVLRLPGVPFWAASEVVTNEDLTAATCRILAD